MKKGIKICLALIMMLVVLVQPVAQASPATSYTYTFNAKKQLVRTQDAYLPKLTMTDLGLTDPSDMFISNQDLMYIADTGNKRIVVYNISTGMLETAITHENMKQPTGVYVTPEGTIYVADPSAQAILSFDKNGELVEMFTRPDSIAFGDTDFKPLKVAVDRAKNLFIVGEGVYNGIIQLSNSGEFLGYFTSNKVALTFTEAMQDLFFTADQKAGLLGRVPLTFSNVFVDPNGIVYTTTAAAIPDAIKKHNTAGSNMLQEEHLPVADTVDVYVDQSGIIYAASLSGIISVYTSEGDFIYSFGTTNKDADIAGLNVSLVSVATDSTGKVWTLDGEKAFVQSFEPTPYAQSTYAALTAYEEGRYDDAVAIWNDVLGQNQMSVLAHTGIAKNYFSQEMYEKAMEHSKVAGNRFYYSQSYWEVRNIQIQSSMFYVLMALIIAYVVYIALKFIQRKYHIFDGVNTLIKKVKSIKIIDDLLFMFDFFKKPIDSYYYLKRNERGSLTGAIIILLSTFVVYVWNLVAKGFIFQYVAAEDIDFNSVILGFFSITLLFVLCNYLVTSITDGEGNLLQIFKMVCYSLAPLFIALLIGTLLSHVVTRDEGFIVDFIFSAGYLWTAINLLLGVQETHNYDTSVAVKSIVISVGFMLIIAVILIVVMLMSQQVYQFFEAIVKEVIRNVMS